MAEGEEARVGVYICHCGGNISDVVDVQEVAEGAGRLPGVVTARCHMFMCSDPGQRLIQEDIEKEGLNRVVVASCSPRLHEETFRNAVQRGGINPYLYEHANIREQVSWVTHAHPDQATLKAGRLVAAAVAKAQRLEPLEPIRVDALRRAAVIGGGIAGLKAARDLAAAGFGVTLIEKSPHLGGQMARLDRVYPTGEDAQRLLEPLIQEVTAHPSIELLTDAEVVAAEGYVGSFRLRVRHDGGGVAAVSDLEAGVIVVATGFEPYEPAPGEYGYGRFPEVVTLAQWQSWSRAQHLADVADTDPSALTPTLSQGEREKGGSRAPHLAGEAETDPSALTLTLSQGEREKGGSRAPHLAGEAETDPSALTPTLSQGEREKGGSRAQHLAGFGVSPNTTSLSSSRDRTLLWNGRPVRSIAMIHCVGSRQIEGVHQPREGQPLHEYCSRVCCTATLQTATQLRESFPDVQVFDFYRDIRSYGRGHEEYYEGAARKGVLFFRFAAEEPPVVERAPEGDQHPLIVRVKDRLSWGEEVEVPVDLVVLATGMVPRRPEGLIDQLKLSVGADGYLLEVHPKLRPVEVAVNGVLLAGSCQGPKDIPESAASASAAAAKAAALLSRGYVELDPFVALVHGERCDGCAECLESCGYEGALTLAGEADPATGRATAAINPALCKGCGSCVAACSKGAIELKGWTLEQFDAMVDAICAGDAVAEVAV